jgi:hypothetical protein
MTTTMTRSPLGTAAGPDHRTRAGLTSLVVGAVLLALGRVLSTNGGSTADRLHQMTGNDVRVSASALLAIAGFTALVPGFLTVAASVRGRAALLGTIGSGLVVVGAVGFSVLAAIDLSTLAATKVSPAAPMREYLHQLDLSPGILVLTPFAVVGYFIGPFLVTLAARRAGFVPGWLPWLMLASLALQPVGVGLGGPGLAHVVDAICQVVLIAAVTVLARATLSACATPSS